MIKNTYLARENAVSPDSPLVEISASEWHRIVEENKNLPLKQRRFFIVSTIQDGDYIDRMFMECSYEEFRAWNVEKTMSDCNRKAEADAMIYSLDAEPEKGNFSFLMEALTDNGSMEESVHQQASLENLRAAVKAWEPWAYDLFLCYEAGQKRTCTQRLAEKYGISEQAMRKRKKLFEEFCKNFFQG